MTSYVTLSYPSKAAATMAAAEPPKRRPSRPGAISTAGVKQNDLAAGEKTDTDLMNSPDCLSPKFADGALKSPDFADEEDGWAGTTAQVDVAQVDGAAQGSFAGDSATSPKLAEPGLQPAFIEDRVKLASAKK